MSHTVVNTELTNLKLLKQGKVRDIYDLDNCLLMIATDRISAFDVVLPDPIPDKGKVLTQISLFWFEIFADEVANHLITANVDDYPEDCRPYRDLLEKRSMLVKKAEPLPIECVVRGYISGSGWNSYRKKGDVCGIALKEGLRESEKLDEPIFTPSTKEEVGLHDINIDFAEAANRIGTEMATKVKDLSLRLYQKGAELANQRGIIIADTKFEFGLMDGELILIDEVLTPDSSRFWPKATYQPGGPQKSFDKQYVRDYLLSLDWDKKAPGPSMPREVIVNTRQKYVEALELLAGSHYAI